MGRAGHCVDLVALQAPEWGAAVPIDESLVRLHVLPIASGRGLAKYIAPREIRTRLAELAVGADVIHSHGLWDSLNIASARVARAVGRPHVISLRGMLDPRSFARKGWKKRLAMRLYGRRSLAGAACLHATAEMEASHIRAMGVERPIVVIPNGLDVEQYERFGRAEARQRVGDRWPSVGGRQYAMYLGRLHPQKGTVELVEAWSSLAGRYPDWCLVLAGPDEGGHQAELQRLVARQGVAERVLFTGNVEGEDKLALLAGADLFVLASHSENFGISVAEALASGCAVITTTEMPWAEVVARGCGWQVPLGAELLAAAMAEALALPGEQRAAMGERGRAWVRETLSWEGVARRMAEMYREVVAGAGER